MSEAYGIEIVPLVGSRPALLAAVRRGFAAGIEGNSFPESREGPTGGESAAVVYVGDDLAGFATFYVPDRTSFVWLDILWVDVKHRRSGIGRQLMEAVIAEANSWKMPLKFGTITSNVAMQRLAAKMGIEVAEIHYQKQPSQ